VAFVHYGKGQENMLLDIFYSLNPLRRKNGLKGLVSALIL